MSLEFSVDFRVFCRLTFQFYEISNQMTKPIFYATVTELSQKLAKEEITAVDIATALLERARTVDNKVNAFLDLNEEDILAQAKASDARRRDGKRLGTLDGIPVCIKDNISVKGQSLTCASKMLENYVAPYDAHVIELLKKAGAVLFGRVNMDEFAMGSSTETSAFKKTANPWNLKHVPGGSSGGSAAAVASGFCPLSLGSDTGGSIRQPASFCGVVGLKPTYGRVSRYGVAALSSSLDQIGPIGRCAEDVAILLQAIAGEDHRDSSSNPESIPDFSGKLKTPITGLKIGLPKEVFTDNLDPLIKEKIMAAVDYYKSQGCEVKEVSLPHCDLCIPVYYVISMAEGSSNLSPIDGIRYGLRSQRATDAIDVYSKSRGEGFGAEVKRRIMLGTYVLSSGFYDAYYLRAQKVRRLIRDDFAKAFEEVDVIIEPVASTTAMPFGSTGDPLQNYLNDKFTLSVNLAGLPGMSVPCGFDGNRLPIGMQLIGKPFDEATLLQLAAAFEAAHDIKTHYPEL